MIINLYYCNRHEAGSSLHRHFFKVKLSLAKHDRHTMRAKHPYDEPDRPIPRGVWAGPAPTQTCLKIKSPHVPYWWEAGGATPPPEGVGKASPGGG